MAVTLYVKTGCPYCAAMRQELQDKGTAFNEVNVSDKREAIAELVKLTGGRREVPVLVDGTTVTVAPSGG